MFAIKEIAPLLMFFLLINEVRPDAPKCPLGTIKETGSNGTIICTPCAADAYNDIQDNDRCFDCYLPDPNDTYVEVESPCTPTQDTKLKCRVSGFYLIPDRKTCWPCTICGDGQIVAKICAGTNNTVCKKQTHCQTKQRLVSMEGPDGLLESCESCPANLTNYADQHRKMVCEDECLEVNESGPVLTLRYDQCKPGESLEGYSCTNKSIAFCKPPQTLTLLPDDTTTPQPEDKPSNNKYNPIVILVIIISVLLIIVPGICTVLFCIEKINNKLNRRRNNRRNLTHDEAASSHSKDQERLDTEEKISFV